MSDQSKSESGCSGCLPLILTVLLLWALCFGITIGGVSHSIGCSCSKGVEIR